MNHFKKDFKRPGFGGGRPMEMFQATCASCGKSCEVPFRPNGKKPVYCRDCFAQNGGPAAGQGPSDRFAPRNDRRPFAPSHAPSFAPRQDSNKGLDDVKRQIEALNVKMDRLISIMGEKAAVPAAAKAVSAPVTPAVEASAAPAKKKAAKKK
jgi:CxxC-x17-CxxC domain-containing protein